MPHGLKTPDYHLWPEPITPLQLKEIARCGAKVFTMQPPDAILDDVILRQWPERLRGGRTMLSQLTLKEGQVLIGVLRRLVEEGHHE